MRDLSDSSESFICQTTTPLLGGSLPFGDTLRRVQRQKYQEKPKSRSLSGMCSTVHGPQCSASQALCGVGPMTARREVVCFVAHTYRKLPIVYFGEVGLAPQAINLEFSIPSRTLAGSPLPGRLQCTFGTWTMSIICNEAPRWHCLIPKHKRRAHGRRPASQLFSFLVIWSNRLLCGSFCCDVD